MSSLLPEKSLLLRKVPYKKGFIYTALNFEGEKNTFFSSQHSLSPGFVIEKVSKSLSITWSPHKSLQTLSTFYTLHFYLEVLDKLPLIEKPLLSLYLRAIFLLEENTFNSIFQLGLVLSKTLLYFQVYNNSLKDFYQKGLSGSLDNCPSFELRDIELSLKIVQSHLNLQVFNFLQNSFLTRKNVQ